MLGRYRPVLTAPGSARLFVTSVLARLPQGMVSLAILLLVRESVHSYALAGLAVGGNAIAAAAGGPFQGRLVDRCGRARVLAPCVATQAALFVALVLCAHAGAPGGVLVVLACAAGATQPAIAGAIRALLGMLFDDVEVRETAYVVESVFQELVWILGPLTVAVTVTVADPTVAVLLAATLGLVGTALFIASPASRVRIPVDRGRRSSVLRSVPALRRLLAPVMLVGVALGATEVGLPSLALHAGSRPSSGLLLAVWSIGSMIGGLVYGARRWRGSPGSRYRALLALNVACALPLAFAHTIPGAMVAALVDGLAMAPVFSCQSALVGRLVAAGSETEAFTWVSSGIIAGFAGGSALGGALIDPFGVDAPFALACAALAVAAVSVVRIPESEVASGAEAAGLEILDAIGALGDAVVRD